jgi:hypothetical protein
MDPSPSPTHYLSPKLAARPVPHKGGMGVFAVEPVARGEVLAMWGGRVVPVEQIYQFDEQQRHYIIQVEEGLFLTPSDPTEAAEYVNHSCDPSAGLNGQIALVALRDIAPGEEVCFDYAMSESHALFEFECRCGSPSCRGSTVMPGISRRTCSAGSIRNAAPRRSRAPTRLPGLGCRSVAA